MFLSKYAIRFLCQRRYRVVVSDVYSHQSDRSWQHKVINVEVHVFGPLMLLRIVYRAFDGNQFRMLQLHSTDELPLTPPSPHLSPAVTSSLLHLPPLSSPPPSSLPTCPLLSFPSSPPPSSRPLPSHSSLSPSSFSPSLPLPVSSPSCVQHSSSQELPPSANVSPYSSPFRQYQPSWQYSDVDSDETMLDVPSSVDSDCTSVHSQRDFSPELFDSPTHLHVNSDVTPPLSPSPTPPRLLPPFPLFAHSSGDTMSELSPPPSP